MHGEYASHALESWQSPRNFQSMPSANPRRRCRTGASIMYAIAGVSGNTGAAVATRLLRAGEKVRVIVRRAEAGASWQAQGAEVAIADLGDASALSAALRGATAAYLLNPPAYNDSDPVGRAAAVGRAFAQAIDAS